MKHARIILWLFITALLSTGCISIDKSAQIAKVREQIDKEEQWRYQLPNKEETPEKPLFPQIKTKRLKNGLTIIVVEDHRLPIAAINFVSKNGSTKDPFGQAGLMHLTGLMLKEGTKKKTSLEFAEAIANLGTELSVSVGKDMSTFSAGILSDKVEPFIDLLAEMIKSPRFATEDFSRVKLQHQALLSSKQGVLSYVAQSKFLLAAYGEKHPYAYPSAGTLASAAKLSLKDVVSSHRHNFGPNDSALIAVGDVTLKQIVAIAKREFGSWKNTSSSLKSIKDPVQAKNMQTHLVARSHAPQTFLLVGQPIIKQNDQDVAILQVLNNIIAGSPTSRLDAILREKKGWTYGVSSSVTPLLGKGPFLIGTSIQLPFGTDALTEILAEFKRLQDEPVTDAELSDARDGLLLSFGSRYSTVGKIASVLVEKYTYDLPENYDEQIYDKIVKVSAEDIRAMANRVLKKDNLIAVAVGDLEAMEAPMGQANVGQVTVERESVD